MNSTGLSTKNSSCFFTACLSPPDRCRYVIHRTPIVLSAMNEKLSLEKDSMGELGTSRCLYAADQRAVENFPISGLKMPPAFIAAVALISVAPLA